MRKIILYGEMAKRFGREHHFSVRSASEAFQAMCVNYPGFKSYMRTAHQRGVGFKVFVGKNSLRKGEDAALPSSEEDTIRVAPAILGSGAVTRIIIGATLITAGALLTGVTFGAGFSLGGFMIATGASLVLGGVFELLAGPPKVPTGGGGLGEDSQSFIFGGPENVTRQGGAVPVGYGRMMVGSTVVSAGIEDQDR